MTGVVEIDYTVLGYIILGLFALVGFFRGWWKEGVTTVLLVLLVVILTQPQAAVSLINIINRVLELLKPVVSITLDPNNRNVYVTTLIVLVTMSYLVGKVGLGGYAVAPMGAILGGVLGAVNGFIVSSLVKEYLLGGFRPGATVTAAAAATPNVISFQVTGVSGQTLSSGRELFWGILIVGIVVLVLLVSTRFELARPSPMVKGKAPAGHK
jgi:hypothetical protein